MRFSQKQFRHYQKNHSQFSTTNQRPYSKMRLTASEVPRFVIQNLDNVNYNAKARQHPDVVRKMIQRYFHRIDQNHVQVSASFLAAVTAVPNPHYDTGIRHLNGRIQDNDPENLKWIPE